MTLKHESNMESKHEPYYLVKGQDVAETPEGEQQIDFNQYPQSQGSAQQQPTLLNIDDTTIQQPQQLNQETYFAPFEQSPLHPPPTPRLSKVLPVPGPYHHRPPPPPNEPWLHYPSEALTIQLIENLTQRKISSLQKVKESLPFKWPGDPGIPHPHSMCLESLSRNLKNNVYSSLRDFMRDFYRIVENAPVRFGEDAESMRHWFETDMEEFKLKGWCVEEAIVLE